MSTEEEIHALSEQCLAVQLGQVQEPDATPEQIQALLEKRSSVGRRNLGRLVCEAEGCSSICTVAVKDGIPRERYMSDATKLLMGCQLWRVTMG